MESRTNSERFTTPIQKRLEHYGSQRGVSALMYVDTPGGGSPEVAAVFGPFLPIRGWGWRDKTLAQSAGSRAAALDTEVLWQVLHPN